MEPDGLPGGGVSRQGRGRPGAPRPALLSPCCQMLGCRNCGQPGLPNATTAASLRAWGGPEAGGGGSPLTQAGFSPRSARAGSKVSPHPGLVPLRSGAAWLRAAVVCFQHQEFRNEA